MKKLFSKKTAFIVVPLLVIAALVTVRMNRKGKLVTAKISKGPIIESVYGIGIITATNSYQLKVATSTSVSKLFVQEGDLVRAGSPLIALEGFPVFRAPFSGTITSLPYKLGESPSPQTTIVGLVDLKNRYFVVNLEQQGALRVKKGQKTRINFESFRDKVFTGRVRTIFANDNQFIVHIDPDELPENLLPGMSADIAIEIFRKDNAILCPVAALQDGKVTRMRSGIQSVIPVEVGTVDGEWAEIKKGELTEGDEVVIAQKK